MMTIMVCYKFCPATILESCQTGKTVLTVYTSPMQFNELKLFNEREVLDH